MAKRTKVQEKLDKALGAATELLESDADIIDVIPEEVKPSGIASAQPTVLIQQTSEQELDSDLVEDYKHARDMLRTLIRKGETALTSAMLVADSSDSPRAYEVVSQLISTIADATMELLELQKKIRETRNGGAKGGKQESGGSTTTITNNTLVLAEGTATDLQKKLRELGLQLPVPK